MSKKITITICLLFSIYGLFAQDTRKNIILPDILGYHTYKADMHMHTIFSDGQVTPYVRVEEAWREGLDIIAITDHLENWNNMLPEDKNLPYEMAKKTAEKRNILLIKGAEITRSLPAECGHMNALFLKDANKLVQKDYMDVINEAEAQGAVLIWNHPGWYVHQPDTTVWFDVFTKLLKEGKLDGIEVVNWKRWFPVALDWCLEKNLAVIAGSDIHGETCWLYNFSKGEHRPITFIFAKEKTEESIKEAIKEGRTVAYFKRGFYNQLMGKEEYLKALFFASVHVTLKDKGKDYATLIFDNRSDLDFNLLKKNSTKGLNYRKNYFLYGHSQEEVNVWIPENVPDEEIYLHFIIQNLLIASDQALEIDVPLTEK